MSHISILQKTWAKIAFGMTVGYLSIIIINGGRNNIRANVYRSRVSAVNDTFSEHSSLSRLQVTRRVHHLYASFFPLYIPIKHNEIYVAGEVPTRNDFLEMQDVVEGLFTSVNVEYSVTIQHPEPD